jgi:hypothetical protein
MVSDKVNTALPEWEGFAYAVQARRPACTRYRLIG